MTCSFNPNTIVLLVILVEFHGSEGCLARYYTPEKFGRGSILISFIYAVAMACSALEFTYFCWSRRIKWTFWVGLSDVYDRGSDTQPGLANCRELLHTSNPEEAK
mmetsp:Transcript_20766/g.30137  ORF Transcript_20766/g.30137 Transcript_20766/m.30137 type:complete len:105 (+) Transcript_20766:685-999(+)